MNDSLSVGCKDLRRYVSIGVYEEERLLKCLLKFNCTALVKSTGSEYFGYSTLDYIEIVNQIDEASKLKFTLLEELGNHILDKISQRHRDIQHIVLEITKLNPLWTYGSGSVFVKIERDFTSSSSSSAE